LLQLLNDGDTHSNSEICDAQFQLVLDQQKVIERTLGQILSARNVSVSDSELELELANLVYGHPEKDYREDSTAFEQTTEKLPSSKS
jgi:hypothetical protein